MEATISRLGLDGNVVRESLYVYMYVYLGFGDLGSGFKV